MKALTLTQPWATLIASGAKRIETRSWNTGYRGRIAIHAAKGLAPIGGKQGFLSQCVEPPFNYALSKVLGCPRSEVMEYLIEEPIPLGAIIATADLADVRRIDMKFRAWVISQPVTPFEIDFGNYDSGRYGWMLENVIPLREPIECNGALSLWEVPLNIQGQIERQLEKAA